MRQVKIKTKEPIKIIFSISEHGNDSSIDLLYKGKTYLYAWMIHDEEVTAISLQKLRVWVEETYYDLDFLSPAYVPCELKASSFRSDS